MYKLVGVDGLGNYAVFDSESGEIEAINGLDLKLCLNVGLSVAGAYFNSTGNIEYTEEYFPKQIEFEEDDDYYDDYSSEDDEDEYSDEYSDEDYEMNMKTMKMIMMTKRMMSTMIMQMNMMTMKILKILQWKIQQ